MKGNSVLRVAAFRSPSPYDCGSAARFGGTGS